MDDIIILPTPGIDLHPVMLPKTEKEGIEKLNLMNPVSEAPKMKAKRTTTTKVKKLKMPKPKKAEKKLKVHKVKTVKKAPTKGGMIKAKHPVHAHHPPWADMMCTAVKCLDDKHGSSMPAIKKYILSNYTIDIEANKITPMLKRGLKAAMACRKLRQVKGHGLAGSFKLDLHGMKMKKEKIGKKIKKGKLVKKGGKVSGKKVLKKDKKTGMKKIKKTSKKMVLKPEMGKIKKMKPKSESKKELEIKKIRKTPTKKSAKVPMMKNPPIILGDVTGLPMPMPVLMT